MSLSCRVVLVAVAALTSVGTTAEASTIQVQDGTLTVVQAAGEQTSVALRHPSDDPAGTWWTRRPPPVVHPGDFPDLVPAPGAQPSPGPGCASASNSGTPGIRCTGVGRIDVALGDGSDYVFLDAGGAEIPIRIFGGGRHDDLTAVTPPGNATVDGGPGDDAISVLSATALGGPGDDVIYLWTGLYLQPVSPLIDCGTGNDRLAVGAALPSWVRPIVDAATCPPLLRPVGPFIDYRVLARVRVPASRKVRLAVFRAAEPVSGKVRTNGCARPVAFRAAAGQQVRVVLTISAGVKRRLDRLRRRDYYPCQVYVTGSDGQGERIGPLRGGYGNLYLTRK